MTDSSNSKIHHDCFPNFWMRLKCKLKGHPQVHFMKVIYNQYYIEWCTNCGTITHKRFHRNRHLDWGND